MAILPNKRGLASVPGPEVRAMEQWVSLSGAHPPYTAHNAGFPPAHVLPLWPQDITTVLCVLAKLNCLKYNSGVLQTTGVVFSSTKPMLEGVKPAGIMLYRSMHQTEGDKIGLDSHSMLMRTRVCSLQAGHGVGG